MTIPKFKMLYFRKGRRHGTENLKNNLFLGLLQPPLDKNSEDLAILILQFDDVTVNSFFSRVVQWREEGGKGGGGGGARFVDFVPSML